MASNRFNLTRVLNSAARRVVTRRSQEVTPRAKAKAGPSGSSLGYTVRGNSYTDLVGRVESRDPKFIYIEEGTKPRIIRPVNGKTLVFPGLSGNRQHATVVFHPGTPGKHALRNALRETIR